MLYLFITPPPKSLVTTELFIVFIVLAFPECHIVEIIKFAAFSDWLLLLVVQSLSHVQFFVPQWAEAHQTPLSSAIFWSLLKFMSIELVMLSISSSVVPFSCPQSFPASGSFPVSWLFTTGSKILELPLREHYVFKIPLSFDSLIAHFFLFLNNSPQRILSSTKDILVASKF